MHLGGNLKKTHKISVVIGKYLNHDNVEKRKTLTIGNIFTTDRGYMKIKIDNAHPLVPGGWEGWANVYEITDEERIPRGAPRDED